MFSIASKRFSRNKRLIRGQGTAAKAKATLSNY